MGIRNSIVFDSLFPPNRVERSVTEVGSPQLLTLYYGPSWSEYQRRRRRSRSIDSLEKVIDKKSLVSRPPQWSVGSRLHDVRQCPPCAFFHRKKGCFKAADCKYCHLCPSEEGF